MPAMRPKIRSMRRGYGVAIVSGFAPGRLASTVTVGYSTSGRRAMGRNRKAIRRKGAAHAQQARSLQGRLIKGAEIFIVSSQSRDFGSVLAAPEPGDLEARHGHFGSVSVPEIEYPPSPNANEAFGQWHHWRWQGGRLRSGRWQSRSQ